MWPTLKFWLTLYLQMGLDAKHIMARIQEQDVKDQLMANTEKSASMGVFGCPSFFVGDELFFGKENMRAV